MGKQATKQSPLLVGDWEEPHKAAHGQGSSMG